MSLLQGLLSLYRMLWQDQHMILPLFFMVFTILHLLPYIKTTVATQEALLVEATFFFFTIAVKLYYQWI